MVWKPHVTVAAIAESEGRFLLVEESIDGRLVLNQPAGHLEDKESLLDAVSREVMEETGYDFSPQCLIGTYLWRVPDTERSYLRFAIAGTVGEAPMDPELDEGIVRALWLTPEEIRSQARRLRSPLVLDTLNDYLDGNQHPLSLMKHIL